MAQRQPRPAPRDERVQRALAMASAAAATAHRYYLGAGDYRSRSTLPCTTIQRTPFAQLELASDCIGAIVHAARLSRARAGFNVGPWSVVSGYVNTDSAIQDAQHERDLFEIAARPEPGDLLCWPSIYAEELLADPQKRRRRGARLRIGHISIVVDISRVIEWDLAQPAFGLLDVVQCGSTHTPAIHRSTGASWAGRETFRRQTRPEWASVLLRPLA